MVEHLFTLEMPATRFMRNTLIASLIGILPLLAIYLALTPGFVAHLATGGPPLTRFVRQILTNGLPVVFIVNYSGFFLFALQASYQETGKTVLLFPIVDLLLRLILFVALHAVIYVVSADWFESFGGNRLTALRVVAPTLARSALFENISGVYLYATLVSALPLNAAILARSHRFGRALWQTAPILGSLALFGLFTVALTRTAKLIVEFQSG